MQIREKVGEKKVICLRRPWTNTENGGKSRHNDLLEVPSLGLGIIGPWQSAGGLLSSFSAADDMIVSAAICF